MSLRKKRVGNVIITDLSAYRNMSTQELQKELKAEKIHLEELENNEPSKNDEISYDNWLEKCSELENAIYIIEHFLNDKNSNESQDKPHNLTMSAERIMDLFLDKDK